MDFSGGSWQTGMSAPPKRRGRATEAERRREEKAGPSVPRDDPPTLKLRRAGRRADRMGKGKADPQAGAWGLSGFGFFWRERADRNVCPTKAKREGHGGGEAQRRPFTFVQGKQADPSLCSG